SKQAAVELDPATRIELYAQLVEYMQNNGPFAMLYQPSRVYALRNNVQGFIYDPGDTPNVSFALISK
ncbi:MAG: hypothetical protein KDE45_00580, partial [Caldilineaceae bacterium]|nr:hypothetical protein [Caldilineaceae bacterium]